MKISVPVNESEFLDQVSRDHLWETNSAIAQWKRLSGTEEAREAFDYVQQVLNKYGLRTTMLEHPALVSYPLDSSLAVVDETGNVVQVYSCLGSAFSASVNELEAEVVDLGFGTPEDYKAQDVAGKVVLLNGLATAMAVYTAEQAGAIGQIFINDDHLHYMIVTTIWGTPTPISAERLPTTPSVSVVEKDGHELRARIAQGSIKVQIKNQVFLDWQRTPILVAELDGKQSDDFVMFSGHLDSWDLSAMDNGSANATMMEVGRLLAQQSEHLYRGLRLVFWSGHEHGLYSSSTWYADNYWEELYDHCVAHVNVDSTGARGATFYGSIAANLELGPFGAEIIQEQTGQQTVVARMGRAADMSFNGIGLPALFVVISQAPFNEQETNYVTRDFRQLFGCNLPWWWHTSDDTIDKVDLDVLALDTKVYLSTLWKLCHNPLLPMDFRPVMADIQETLKLLDGVAGDHLDLSITKERVDRLTMLIETLAQRCVEVRDTEANLETIQTLNRQMKALSRILIPLTYTAAGRFDHDPAWGLPHLPILSDVQKLAQLNPNSNAHHFLRTQLVRNQNKVNFTLREAIEVLVD